MEVAEGIQQAEAVEDIHWPVVVAGDIRLRLVVAGGSHPLAVVAGGSHWAEVAGDSRQGEGNHPREHHSSAEVAEGDSHLQQEELWERDRRNLTNHAISIENANRTEKVMKNSWQHPNEK